MKIIDGKKFIYSLHLGDIHFGKKDDIKLYEELKEGFISKIHEKGNEIDFIILQGDLYDRILKLNEIGGKLVIDFINELCDLSIKYDFKLRIIKGTKTHDYNQLQVFKNLEGKFINLKIINTVQEEEILEDVFVLYIPEEYVDNVNEYYEEYFNLEEGSKYDYIFGHGMFDFVAFNSEENDSERIVKNAPTFKSKDLADISYSSIIFGHIHDRTQYKNKIFYTGSFSRFAFGENKNKGYIENYYCQDNLETITKYIDNTLAPKYITLDLDTMDFDNAEDQISFINDIKEEYDFIRIRSSENTENNIDLLKKLLNEDHSVKIEINKNIIEEDKVDEKYLFIIKREYDLPTTIQKYIKIKYNKDISSSLVQNVISLEKS